MSLIEQAAKRLEELRRAGAETREDPGQSRVGGVDAANGSLPTPEAVVRSLEIDRIEPTLRGHPGGKPGFFVNGAETRAGSPERPGAVRSAPQKEVLAIDFERLKRLGFVTPDDPRSQIADEYRVIKRPILRNAQRNTGAQIRNGNLIMVTSALPGEGKTFTAINLAISLAMEVDTTVLLVDGDVLHPSVPDLIGGSRSPGLLDLLTDDKLDVRDALVRTNIDKLAIIPAGSRHRHATELLASAQMSRLLAELASFYSDRIIIFDSPPLLATTEARVLATNMGQIIMVVAAEATTQHVTKQALAAVENCEIVLMLLNKARKTDIGAYYGYYADEVPR